MSSPVKEANKEDAGEINKEDAGEINKEEKRFVVNIPQHETCSICLETLQGSTTIIIEPCKHMIHLSCLNRQTKCPLCRGDLPNPLGNNRSDVSASSAIRDAARARTAEVLQSADRALEMITELRTAREELRRLEREPQNIPNFLDMVTEDTVYFLRNTPFDRILASTYTGCPIIYSTMMTLSKRHNPTPHHFLIGMIKGVYKFFDIPQKDRYSNVYELIRIGYGDRRRTGKKSLALFQEKFDQLNTNAKTVAVNLMKPHIKSEVGEATTGNPLTADTKTNIYNLFVNEITEAERRDVIDELERGNTIAEAEQRNKQREDKVKLATEISNLLFP